MDLEKPSSDARAAHHSTVNELQARVEALEEGDEKTPEVIARTADVHRAIAELLRYEGRREEALVHVEAGLRHLTKGLEPPPEAMPRQAGIARLLLLRSGLRQPPDLGDAERALQILKELGARDPKRMEWAERRGEAHMRVAYALLAQDRLREARAHAGEAIEVIGGLRVEEQRTPDLWVRLGDAQKVAALTSLRLRLPDDAARHCEAAVQAYAHPLEAGTASVPVALALAEIHGWRAQLFRSEREWSLAAEACRAALEVLDLFPGPTVAQERVLRARVNSELALARSLAGAREFLQAAETAKEALDRIPKAQDVPWRTAEGEALGVLQFVAFESARFEDSLRYARLKLAWLVAGDEASGATTTKLDKTREEVRLAEMLTGERDVESPVDHRTLANLLCRLGQFVRGTQQYEKALQSDSIRNNIAKSNLYLGARAAAFASQETDDPGERQRFIDLAIAWLRDDLELHRARVESARSEGDTDAIKQAESAFDQRQELIGEGDATLAPLRSEPAFRELIAK